MTIHVFVDGSCKGNGSKGAVGAFGVYFNDYRFRKYNRIEFLHGNKITNNVAELTAILSALNSIHESKSDEHFEIVTDSQYSLMSVIGKYNGKINNKIIQECRQLITPRISFKHVRSHQTEPKDKRSTEWYFWAGNDFIDDSINQIYN
jgi:ribonuclease HI